LKIENERKAEDLRQSSIFNLQFSISDTGPGIAREEMNRLFEAFSQTETGRQMQEGTGLGLSISRKFVQLMGGDITVKSELGTGTTFTFEIPVGCVDQSTIDKEQATILKRAIALEPGQPRYRLLIVDDKPDNRKLLVKLFSNLSSPNLRSPRSGFDLREAVNGQEAIEIWRTWKPHLIWMDIRMPVMGGYEATKRIRSLPNGNETKIIVLSASAFEEERDVALAKGGDDFLRKPFQEAEMFDLLTKHLGVRFVYEDVRARGPVPLLTPETLAALPEKLQTELHHAVEAIDLDAALRLIEQVRGHNDPLADALVESVNGYRFDILQALFEQSEGNKKD
jgi:CheY-like chemotaxis protein